MNQRNVSKYFRLYPGLLEYLTWGTPPPKKNLGFMGINSTGRGLAHLEPCMPCEQSDSWASKTEPATARTKEHQVVAETAFEKACLALLSELCQAHVQRGLSPKGIVQFAPPGSCSSALNGKATAILRAISYGCVGCLLLAFTFFMCQTTGAGSFSQTMGNTCSLLWYQMQKEDKADLSRQPPAEALHFRLPF